MKQTYIPKRDPDFTFARFAASALWLMIGVLTMACSMLAIPALVALVFGFGG